jgi:hypothetical protein
MRFRRLESDECEDFDKRILPYVVRIMLLLWYQVVLYLGSPVIPISFVAWFQYSLTVDHEEINGPPTDITPVSKRLPRPLSFVVCVQIRFFYSIRM